MKNLLILFISIGAAISQPNIDADCDSLSKYIGYWSPAILSSEDSMAIFKERLVDYINNIEQKSYNLSDSSEYYFRLGQAYHFGHNIDIPGSYHLAEM